MTTPTLIPPAPSIGNPDIGSYSMQAVGNFGNAWRARDAAQIAEIERLTALTDPSPSGPIFGMNLEKGYADAVSRFGSVPIAKLFDGGSGVLPSVTEQVPGSKRGQACWKPSSMADLAAGKENASIEAYVEKELAAGAKTVKVTPWQEPNGELKSGVFSVDTYRQCVIQASKAVRNVGVKGKVFIAQTFTAQQTREGSTCLDSWIVTPDLLGGTEWSVICWDNYLNPVGAAKYGGDPYATPYPAPGPVADEMYAQTERTGYGESWAISEWGCPWRKNIAGGDADQGLRLSAMQAYIDYVLAFPTLPKHVMLWTGMGTKFDQTVGPKIINFWKGYLAQSA